MPKGMEAAPAAPAASSVRAWSPPEGSIRREILVNLNRSRNRRPSCPVLPASAWEGPRIRMKTSRSGLLGDRRGRPRPFRRRSPFSRFRQPPCDSPETHGGSAYRESRPIQRNLTTGFRSRRDNQALLSSAVSIRVGFGRKFRPPSGTRALARRRRPLASAG